MRPRRHRNDPAAINDVWQQQVGDDEITHVVEGKGHLQPVRRFFTLGKNRARIVNQDVNLRLGGGYFVSHPLHFGQPR